MNFYNSLPDFDLSAYDLLSCVLVFNPEQPEEEIWIEI